jgi:hypothetical protein
VKQVLIKKNVLPSDTQGDGHYHLIISQPMQVLIKEDLLDISLSVIVSVALNMRSCLTSCYILGRHGVTKFEIPNVSHKWEKRH